MNDRVRLTRSSKQKPVAGLIHFGPGAFFRAFNAVYTQEAMQASGGDWGIIAVGLQSSTTQDLLKPQDNVYTSVTLNPDGEQHQIVESIIDVLVARDNPDAVLKAMIDPRIRVVSLTITEKGYCHEPATGKLNLEHPDIKHDLTAKVPRSALGFIVAALVQRRANGDAPFTILSCDNLPSNGKLARGVVVDYACQLDAELAQWIANEVSFPSTMVDRITPATTSDDVEKLSKTAGYFDPACVQHEPFRQWVIEDDFPTGRPAWDVVGAQMVTSVDAHELMKLRCLNGTHSTLAYLGYLAGYETIAQTVADNDFAQLCKTLWEREILPTIEQPEGEDLLRYSESLLTRYQNPAIHHRTWQIAMDGSQKLPQRILNTIADNLTSDRSSDGLILAVAGWMRYVGGVDESGQVIDVKDPLAQRLKVSYDNAVTPADKVSALLAERDVFDEVLQNSAVFHAALVEALTALLDNGAKATVHAFNLSNAGNN